MRPTLKIAGAFLVVFSVSLALVPEAQAFRGRGAAFVVGAAVGSANASDAEAQAASSQQQAAAAQQDAAAARKEAELAKQQAAGPGPAAAPGAPLPLGTVVSTLPGGCTATPVGGVNYYYCGGNFYQAVLEGSNVRYVTTKPK